MRLIGGVVLGLWAGLALAMPDPISRDIFLGLLPLSLAWFVSTLF